MKAATLFSGGGLVECAIASKGLKSILGVEKDPSPKRALLTNAIADTYELNFPESKLIRESVENIDWESLGIDDLFLLHASPSCKSFSDANMVGEENWDDIIAAEGTARAILSLKPLYFTLENVREYTKSVSFEIILKALKNEGYAYCYDILNAYHYGVPQDRERLCLIAYKGSSLVPLPSRVRPISWFDVLSDRIPYMTQGIPTQTQEIALNEIRSLYPDTASFIVERVGHRNKVKIRHPYDPCWTITTSIFTDGKGSSRRKFINVWHLGEWYDLSLRDIAILQTVPKSYILPTLPMYAGAVLGNGVPCKLYEAILDQILFHAHRYGKITITAKVA